MSPIELRSAFLNFSVAPNAWKSIVLNEWGPVKPAFSGNFCFGFFFANFWAKTNLFFTETAILVKFVGMTNSNGRHDWTFFSLGYVPESEISDFEMSIFRSK